MSYGGFSNYPTYALTLWIDNESALYEDILLLTRQTRDVYALSVSLKDYIFDIALSGCELNPELNPIATDLLEYCLEIVDYYELASHYWSCINECE